MAVSLKGEGDFIFYFGKGYEALCEKLQQEKKFIFLFHEQVSLPELWQAFRQFREQEPQELLGHTAYRGSMAVLRAIQYISAHYKEHIGLEAVAGAVYVNPSYLSRLFMKECGKSFVDVLSGYRIAEAKRLLLETDYDIERITGLVGYRNSKYFMKTFKKFTDETPGQYRRLHREKGKN